METLSAVYAGKTGPGVYVASQSLLYKVDIDGQAVLWHQDIEGLGTSLTIAQNKIYAYSSQHDSYMYAFSADDGQLLWATRVTDYKLCDGVQLNELISSAVSQDVVYVNSREGSVFALAVHDGALLWTCKASDTLELNLGSLALTLQDDVLYLTTGNRLHAIDTRLCQEQWASNIAEEQVFFSQTIVDGIVYASADQDPDGSYIYAFDARSGTRIWSSALIEDPIFDAPVICQGALYCTGAMNIYALDISSGELLWSTFVGLTNYMQPRIADGSLFIGLQGEYLQELTGEPDDGHSCLLALRLEDGSLVWQRHLPIPPLVQRVEQGIVYVSSAISGDIYTFDAQEGEPLWHFADPTLTPQYTASFGATTIVIPP